jgi:cytochrome c oxidase subunit IV
MDGDQTEHRLVPYRTYVLVWLVLLVFTGATIGVSLLDLGKISTSASILIASAKCSLVLAFFMGLKYDKPVFRRMFLVTVFTFAIFIILTYSDYLTR